MTTNGQNLAADRMKELVAIAIVGDGVMSFTNPSRHTLLWTRGPRAWRDAMTPFARHPGVTRWLGAAQVAIGVWLASRQRAR